MTPEQAERVEKALDRAQRLIGSTSTEARVDRALALAKMVTMPLSTPPPKPAINARKITVTEVSLEGAVGRPVPSRLKKQSNATLIAMDVGLHSLHKQHFELHPEVDSAANTTREELAKAHMFVLEEMVRRGLPHPERSCEDELDRISKAKHSRFRRLYAKAAAQHTHEAPHLCRLCVPDAKPQLQKRDASLAIRPWTHEVKVLKTDLSIPSVAEERFVLGVVLEPETVDAQKDVYSAAEIRKAAHGFMEHHGHIGLMHKQMIDGRVKILESYVAPADFIVDGQTVKKGTWMLAARIVDDQLWKMVKDGSFNGWSIGGTAVKEPDPEYSALMSLFGS